MGIIESKKALKSGYRYIWEEETQFIIYQNNQGDLILGTSAHGGLINENEILELIRIQFTNFKINFMGKMLSMNLKINLNKINFEKLNAEEAKIIKNTLISYLFNDFHRIESNQIAYEGNISSVILTCNEKYAIYWELEQDNGYLLATRINTIIMYLLRCLYKIGRTRTTLNTNMEEVEDYENNQLLEVIIRKFTNNEFEILEESEKDINCLHAVALKENEMYDKNKKILEEMVTKLATTNQMITEEDSFKVSQNAIIYKTIVGKTYLLSQKVIEQTEEYLKLQRTKKI